MFDRCYATCLPEYEQTDPQAVTAIIWDLDNTLYAYDQKFHHASQKAMTQVILDNRLGMNPSEALAYASEPYPMQTIGRLQKEFGLDRQQLFSGYFNRLDESFLEPDPVLKACARSACASVKFGLLTHGTRSWADRALFRLGLGQFFPSEYRYTVENMREDKHSGPASLSQLFRRMGVHPSQAIVVDDKDKNLGPAGTLGCLTILVTNADPDPSTPATHAKHVYDYSRDFLADFNRNGRSLKNGQHLS
jgi:FMN phosphatase YigB (HAD superfamily)